GPNGAGKSTTLRILAGFLGPTAGTVVMGGHDVTTDSLAARGRVGYMPEAAPLYPEMRVAEYIQFRAELKRVPRAERRAAGDEAMGRAGVLDVAHRRIGHLSKGYRQRVALADALVGRPPILLLDEPEACATRILVLHHGKVVASGPAGELRATQRPTAVVLTLGGDAAAARRALAAVEG